MNTAERVCAILARELDVEPERLKPNALIAQELGGDSIDRCEIAMSLEEAFHIKVTTTESAQAQTVQDYIRLIEGKIL